MRRLLCVLSAVVLCSHAYAKDVVSEASQKVQTVNNQVQVINKPQQILNQVQEIQQQAQQLKQQGQHIGGVLGGTAQVVGQTAGAVSSGVSQVLNPIAQTSQQVMNAYNQVYGNIQSTFWNIKNVYNTLHSIQSVWESFKKGDSPLKKIYSVLYGIGNITGYLNQIEEGIGKTLAKILPSIQFPPKFFVGVPKWLQVGNTKVEAVTTADVNLNGLDGTGDYLPNQVLQQYCIAHPNEGVCSSLTNFDMMSYWGATAGVPFIDLSASEIKKDLANAEAVMTAPSQALTPDGRVLAVNKRSQYMMAAVTSTGYLPYGKEVSENANVPKALRLKYAEVVGKSAIRDAYIKSFQKRIQVHYQELVKLKALVDQVCSMPVASPEETCGAGGVLGGVGSVFNPLNSLTSVQSKVNSVSSYIEGRGACCGVCWKAVAQAKANAGLIKAGTTTIVSTIHQAENQLAQVVSIQDCMTRNTIREEQTATRNTIKTYQCLLLRIQLRRALIELDQLEAEAANMGANISQLQNTEFNSFEKERRKLIERGLR